MELFDIPSLDIGDLARYAATWILPRNGRDAAIRFCRNHSIPLRMYVDSLLACLGMEPWYGTHEQIIQDYYG